MQKNAPRDHNVVGNEWETNRGQMQNHAAKAPKGRQVGESGRQVRDKCRIVQPRAPTAHRETVWDK